MSTLRTLLRKYNRKLTLTYIQALGSEKNTFNRARIITMLKGLYFSFGFYFIYFFFDIFGVQNQLKWRILPFIFLTIGGIYLTWKGKWKLTAYFIASSATILNVCVIIFPNISSDIFLIQNVTLSILISYILLDMKIGSIYTALNLLTIIFYFSTIKTTKNINIDISSLFILLYTFLYIILYIWNFLKVIKKVLILNEKEIKKRGLLNHDLEVVASTAEKLANSKTDFLSNMTHELRTPLNSVIGFSHLLLQENPTEAQKQNLNLLLFSAENLLALINNILDFNKLDIGKIELEKFDFNLSVLLDKLYYDSKLKTERKNIALIIEYDPLLKEIPITGDITRLTQILYNLLENAIKFTNKGSISLSVIVVDQTENNLKIRFIVKDTGIGIHPEALLRIFKPFEQAEVNISRQFGGTGLGLSIVKKLLDLHDSQLNYNSIVNIGTTFEFEIKYPISTTIVSSEISKPTDTLPYSFEKIKVLLVEDNQMNLLLMSKIFEKWNIKYQTATNGKESLELAINQDFDLIFMDINMPIMNGVEAGKIIINSKPEACIIALTANTTNYEEHDEFKQIFKHYISKPIIQDKLLNLLRLKSQEKNNHT